MSGSQSGHRADFSVRCPCGEVYNSNDSHVGKKIRCQCGRIVTIARPSESADRFVAPSKAPSVAQSVAAQMAKETDRKTRRRRVTGGGLGTWLRAEVDALTDPRPLRRWTARLAWLSFFGCVVLWLIMITTADDFEPATWFTYGPRYLIVLPLAMIGCIAIIVSRRSLLPISLALATAVGPLIGGRVSLRSIARGAPEAPASGTMRVMSFNAGGSDVAASKLREIVAQLRPDVIAVQECSNALSDSLAALPDMHSVRDDDLCSATRWPASTPETMPRNAARPTAEFGMAAASVATRQFVQTPNGNFLLVNVQMESNRPPADDGDVMSTTSMDRTMPGAREVDGSGRTRPVRKHEMMRMLRDRESERLSVWAMHGDRTIPTVVAGTFALPVESTVFRDRWGFLTDAFDASGSGFGWTYRASPWVRQRVDHVLLNDSAPRSSGTWVGPDLGLAHLPIVADLRWPSP